MSALGIDSNGGPISAPEPDSSNTGSITLSKGGAFVGFLSGSQTRTYEIEFTSSTDYKIRYKDGDGAWSDEYENGSTTNDEVFGKSKAYILKHWWSNIAQAGDKFTFTADPTSRVVDMPVLFHEVTNNNGDKGAGAMTINFVNSLLDSTQVLTGLPFGPWVDWNENGNNTDILNDYARSAFVLAGYTAANINQVDAYYYHHLNGFIHCGTNVIRNRPPYHWWQD